MLENPSHAAIVRSIIDLGHNLGLRVVAEGVETRDVFRALHESGCDVAQGFSLARPMPVGDLPRFFAAVADISLSRGADPRATARSSSSPLRLLSWRPWWSSPARSSS